MRHDYSYPQDYESFTPEEKSRWMTQERCRRLHSRMRKKRGIKSLDELLAEKERIENILEARGYEDLSDKR